MLKIYSPGTLVLIGNRISALVNRVQIIGPEHHVSYEVVWWVGDERREQWLAAHEVCARDGSETFEIGFHSC